MNLQEHANRDAMKVWLSADEVDQLVDHPDEPQRKIAFALAARCGLRSHEVLEVAPEHVHDSAMGTILRVHHGKGDKYRETPMPDELASVIETAQKYRDASQSQPIVDVTTTKALRDWIHRARDELAADTDDDAWLNVSWHDLRRTWATALASKDVDPLVVCDWGGWNDLDTFLEHYRGTFSPEAQRREREKVDWL